MNKIKKIVLTGGPCAGKSTIIQSLQKHLCSNFSLIPEVATQVLGSGIFPHPNTWTSVDVQMFQTEVYRRQIAVEATIGDDTNFVVLDRGTLDGVAYLSNYENWASVVGAKSLEEELDRYDIVIFLNSLASTNPDLYTMLKGQTLIEKNLWKRLNL